MPTQLYIFFGSTQLIFTGVALFGAILGINTVFKYSAEDRNFYYPTWIPAVSFYLVHFLEIIYILTFFSPRTLLFINAMGLLMPITLTLLTWDRFFFFQKTNRWIKFLFFIPFTALIPLFINIFYPSIFSNQFEEYISNLVYLLLLIEVTFFVFYQIYCHHRQLRIYEMEYSNISDFPKNFAVQMCFVLLIWVSLHLFMFMTNSPLVKAYVDIIRTVIGIIITLSWMKENRSKKMEKPIELNQTDEVPVELQSTNQILQALHQLMKSKQIFLNPELRLSDLQSMLGTNRTYLSNAINSIPGQTFYSIVQGYRIDYAKELLTNQPEYKIDDIAIQAGFSSRSFFSRTFKDATGLTPTQYRQQSILMA